MVEKDTGFAGEKVSFSPCDATTPLGKVTKSYVQLGQQPTIIPDPILLSEVKTLKNKVTTLEERVTHLLHVAEPTTYRQLIEKKRERLWETHGSEFTNKFPDSITKDSYYSREDQRIIIKSLPKHWSQFLDFVKKELRPLPTFWEVLHGGKYSDYSNFSEGIHSLPEKEVYLKIVHPTGVYADLFADIYGMTVEECLATGEENKSVAAEAMQKPSTKSGGDCADDCMPQKTTSCMHSI